MLFKGLNSDDQFKAPPEHLAKRTKPPFSILNAEAMDALIKSGAVHEYLSSPAGRIWRIADAPIADPQAAVIRPPAKVADIFKCGQCGSWLHRAPHTGYWLCPVSPPHTRCLPDSVLLAKIHKRFKKLGYKKRRPENLLAKQIRIQHWLRAKGV